jgi:hypothetical protein
MNRSNSSSQFAPPPSQITHHQSQAVYVYSVGIFWLAYGLEIFFSLVIALIGIYMFHSSGASFGNNFSSILRSAYNAKLSTAIDESDMNGIDPLPPYLSKATITLPALKKHRQSSFFCHQPDESFREESSDVYPLQKIR